MINKTILVGRITKDLELRKTQNGASVTSFTLAVNRRTQNKVEQQADFISCVAWNKTAENMCQYLRKGSQIALEGRIQTRNYDDSTGKRVYVTEVVCESVEFLDTKNSNSQPSYTQTPNIQPYAPVEPVNTPVTDDYDYQPADTLDIASDDLPF